MSPIRILFFIVILVSKFFSSFQKEVLCFVFPSTVQLVEEYLCYSPD